MPTSPLPTASPATRVSLRHLLVAITDILGAMILMAWALILGPLGFLRGTLSLSNTFWYVWVLSPQGLLSRLVKAAIDWRLGNFDAAVFQMEFLCSRVEHYLARNPRYRHAHTVLEDFYTLLVRAYLHGGHIDDAMTVVLRAKKHLNADRLPSLARLDAKTAHLVRAGLAAGKLLDGGGLATLFVKSTNDSTNNASNPLPAPPPRSGDRSKLSPASQTRQGASAVPLPPKGVGGSTTGKVIPFPTPKRPPPDSTDPTR